MKRLAMVMAGGSLLLGLAGVAPAADVKLLKQPGSFPLVISAPGSYRLKGNITVPDENTTAIQIDADNVTLDLNGYTISGPTVCNAGPPNNPLSCVPTAGTGTGSGISGNHSNITIVNGTIQGMGNRGILLNAGYGSRLERLRIVSNGGGGIEVGDRSIATGNLVERNAYVGIFTNQDSTVSGNTVADNGTYGIYASRSTVTGNTSIRNSIGIDNSLGGVVIGNTVTLNTGYGLVAGCAGFSSAYSQNTFYENNGGNMNTQVQCGVNMGMNVCGTAACP